MMNPEVDIITTKFDAEVIKKKSPITDSLNRGTLWQITRYENKKDFKNQVIYEEFETKDCFDGYPQVTVISGNVALKEGILELSRLIATSGATKWDNANAYLGVGTDDTAETSGDEGILANPVYKAMDATFPQIGDETITWQSTFGADDANQAWEEYSISNSNSNSGVNFNRKTDTQGIKLSGQTWQLQMRSLFS